MKNFFLIFLILGCSRIKNKEEQPKITIKDFSISESFSGYKNWILFADSARESENYSYIIYGVKISFLSADRETLSKLYSDSGLVFEETGNLIAYSNVNVITGDSIKLLSDSLKWNNKIEKIIIDGNFKYWTKDEYIEGEGMESDRLLKEIVIKKRIKGKGEYKR